MNAASYDGNGLRATATITPAGNSAISESYTWDTSQKTPWLLMDSANAYVYDGDGAPAEQVSIATGAVTYLATDSLQSVRGTINSSGSLTATTSYDTWGNPFTAGGLTGVTPFGFAGGYTDPTGLIYLEQRYYEPQTGQFTSLDPIVSQTLQPYAYANGDPVSQVDPTGTSGGWWEGGAGATWGGSGLEACFGASGPVTAYVCKNYTIGGSGVGYSWWQENWGHYHVEIHKWYAEYFPTNCWIVCNKTYIVHPQFDMSLWVNGIRTYHHWSCEMTKRNQLMNGTRAGYQQSIGRVACWSFQSCRDSILRSTSISGCKPTTGSEGQWFRRTQGATFGRIEKLNASASRGLRHGPWATGQNGDIDVVRPLESCRAPLLIVASGIIPEWTS
jgi:RHS repeat-associated protein